MMHPKDAKIVEIVKYFYAKETKEEEEVPPRPTPQDVDDTLEYLTRTRPDSRNYTDDEIESAIFLALNNKDTTLVRVKSEVLGALGKLERGSITLEAGRPLIYQGIKLFYLTSLYTFDQILNSRVKTDKEIKWPDGTYEKENFDGTLAARIVEKYFARIDEKSKPAQQ